MDDDAEAVVALEEDINRAIRDAQPPLSNHQVGRVLRRMANEIEKE